MKQRENKNKVIDHQLVAGAANHQCKPTFTQPKGHQSLTGFIMYENRCVKITKTVLNKLIVFGLTVGCSNWGEIGSLMWRCNQSGPRPGYDDEVRRLVACTPLRSSCCCCCCCLLRGLGGFLSPAQQEKKKDGRSVSPSPARSTFNDFLIIRCGIWMCLQPLRSAGIARKCVKTMWGQLFNNNDNKNNS